MSLRQMNAKTACTCGCAMRMNSMVAAMALSELRKHDNNAADRIIAHANSIQHKDWCGSAAKWLKARAKKGREAA